MSKCLSTVALLVLALVAGCQLEGLKEHVNQTFGDQHFKTAIALIELHKVRTESYPEQLDDIRFIGEWDAVVSGTVEYEKLDSGYRLDLVRGWIGKPDELQYPDEFWKGLGLRSSNLKRNQKQTKE